MHLEASTTLHTTTTFCFRTRGAFLKFCSSLTVTQKGMLKHIHIHLAETFEAGDTGWQFTDDEPLPDLHGLRSLHMSIDMQLFDPFFFDHYRRNAALDGSYGEHWDTGLLRFQSYTLDTATVVVSDYLYVPALRNSNLDIAVKEKRAFAEQIRLRLLSPDGAEVARRSQAMRLCAMRKLSRKRELRCYKMGIVTAKRSERVGEAVEELRAFRESLSRIPIWLSEGRLDGHSASFMITGRYIQWRNSYEELTANDQNLYEQHLEVAANYVPSGTTIQLPIGRLGRPSEPRITISHIRRSYERCEQCPFPKIAVIESYLQPVTIVVGTWPWVPLPVETRASFMRLKQQVVDRWMFIKSKHLRYDASTPSLAVPPMSILRRATCTPSDFRSHHPYYLRLILVFY